MKQVDSMSINNSFQEILLTYIRFLGYPSAIEIFDYARFWDLRIPRKASVYYYLNNLLSRKILRKVETCNGGYKYRYTCLSEPREKYFEISARLDKCDVCGGELVNYKGNTLPVSFDYNFSFKSRNCCKLLNDEKTEFYLKRDLGYNRIYVLGEKNLLAVIINRYGWPEIRLPFFIRNIGSEYYRLLNLLKSNNENRDISLAGISRRLPVVIS